jgi:NAD(P)-dependent dehydrogenase (short-subunit alcohol dehydrogenase family)
VTQSPLHQDRIYAVTGAASGIGAATAERLEQCGARVIGCDLRDAEVIADLATADGRAALSEGVARVCEGRLDGIVANAGGGPAETMLALNYFGALATLEGLRPLLLGSPAPRAVVVSSISSLGPTDPALIEACEAGDEAAAIIRGAEAIAAGKSALDLYGSAKHALTRWCRRAAAGPQWAGAGVPLNVVAPGIIDTPAAAYILADPDLRAQMGAMVPLQASYPGAPEAMAALLGWCVSPENNLMTGQVLFADAGFECQARGEKTW